MKHILQNLRNHFQFHQKQRTGFITMNFTSIVFLFFFFPITIFIYYGIQLVLRNRLAVQNAAGKLLLILFSIFFFAWADKNLLLWFLLYMFLVFLTGQVISCLTVQKHRLCVHILGIITIIGILFFYKYYNFTVELITQTKDSAFALKNITVPAGISFITFSSVSYLTDIYRREAAGGNLLDVMLYLSFFPKLLSGPIVRWKDFSGQLSERKVNDTTFLYGINRLMIGFSKKILLADTFGQVIHDIMAQVNGKGIDCPTSWGCAFLYMMQIYYDFAGYSDIAIGLSSLFGFQFKENFHFPYISQSVSEFWRRWHMSLGSFFREYIYIPLGGNRKGFSRTLMNLGIVFLITGIWHGAGLNFLWWGILNGACVILERCIRNTDFYQKIPSPVKWLLTMLIVLFSWQLFRFSTIKEFTDYLDIMTGAVICEGITYTWSYFFTWKIRIYLILAAAGATVFALPFTKKIVLWSSTKKTGLILKEVVLLLLMIWSVITMVNSTYSPFLYFQY